LLWVVLKIWYNNVSGTWVDGSVTITLGDFFNMDFTRSIAKFIVNSDAEKIPQTAFEHAKIAFMDWMGVTLAGKEDPLVAKLVNYSDLMGGNEQATIIGLNIKKSIVQAALINGAASHALDFDDSLEAMVGHPTVTLYPALLAVSEWKEMTGKDLLTGYLVGLKAGSAIASCGGMEHYIRGWHGTGTYGHFASAAGCARLLGLDEDQTVFALGLAGTQASGLKISFGTMCKPYHAGKASQAGLISALLAADGFTSAQDIIEGKSGFIDVFSGKYNEDALAILSGKWEVEDLVQKYHPSCHATHSPIEGALSIVKDEGVALDDIKSINITVSPLAVGAAGKPEPKTGLEGKFSISYCVANALLRGDTGTKAFTEAKVNDPAVVSLMEKITLEVTDKFKALEAITKIKTTSGKVFTASMDVMSDIPKLETKKVKIRDKFIDLSSPAIGESRAEELADAITALETLDNVRNLLALMRR